MKMRVSDDPFATQLSILNKTFEDVTVADITCFDDMLVSVQEPRMDINDQHESDEDDSQSEVSEVLVKPNPPPPKYVQPLIR